MAHGPQHFSTQEELGVQAPVGFWVPWTQIVGYPWLSMDVAELRQQNLLKDVNSCNQAQLIEHFLQEILGVQK